jgi:hypothetical protein
MKPEGGDRRSARVPASNTAGVDDDHLAWIRRGGKSPAEARVSNRRSVSARAPALAKEVRAAARWAVELSAFALRSLTGSVR